MHGDTPVASEYCASVRIAKLYPSEVMEGFEDFALEVDSVIDLIVPIADETLDAVCGHAA